MYICFFLAVRVSNYESGPVASGEVSNFNFANDSILINEATFSESTFASRNCCFIFVREPGWISTVQGVQVKLIRPSWVRFGTVIACLTHVTCEIVNAAKESEGEGNRRSVFYVFRVVIYYWT